MKIKIKSKNCGRLTSDHFVRMKDYIHIQTKNGQEFIELDHLDELKNLFNIKDLALELEFSDK